MKTDFDIVIVGCGMVGASLACLLAELPLRLAIIDRAEFAKTVLPVQQPQPNFDPRVSAITQASKQLFSKIGLWSDIEELRCCNYTKMKVWDADGTGSIGFSADELKQSELGFIVENSIITSLLQSKLRTQANLEILTPLTVDALSEIEIEGECYSQLQMESGELFTSKLVIAADGANSKIRALANFKTREWDYQHHALVTTVRTTEPHEHTALQRFIDTGPLAFLPLASQGDGQHYSSIVWSMVPEMAAEVMAMSDVEFRQTLTTSIEKKLGDVDWSAQRFSFPLRQRHAIDYVKENIVLIGDAAHSIHPLAGQGVNLGLLDARVLGQELSIGVSNGRDINDKMVLKRYQRKRIGHNLGMMGLMEGFKYLFAEQSLPVRWLRNAGMSGVDSMPVIKNTLARRAMGLDWE